MSQTFLFSFKVHQLPLKSDNNWAFFNANNRNIGINSTDTICTQNKCFSFRTNFV